jgi:hypothetical protein
MGSLHELHAQLTALRDAGKSAKVSFYYPKDPSGEDPRMLSGHIAVDQGARCYVSLQGLPADEALALIPSLPFSRVASLPALRFGASAENDVAVPIDEVLTALEPRRKPALPAAEAGTRPASGPAGTADARPTPTGGVTPAPERGEASAPRAFYSHVAMRADAVALLETLFGLGAARKVDEFALDSPPHQRPGEFLGKCMKQAAMMIGHRKAAQMFAPIYGKAGLPLP